MTTTDFDNLPSVFAEAHRVLRPGGRLVVIAARPCRASPHHHRVIIPSAPAPGSMAENRTRTG